VYCVSEPEMLIKFALIIAKRRPDIVTGFNDFGFDWKVVWIRLEKYGLLSLFCWIIEVVPCDDDPKKIFRNWKVKVGGDFVSVDVPNFISFLAVDTKIVLQKSVVIKDTRHSLSAYAKSIGKDKKDVPYNVQHSIVKLSIQNNTAIINTVNTILCDNVPSDWVVVYEGKNLSINEVAEYGYIDSKLLKDLWNKYQLLQNKHQLCIMSFVYLNDAFINADARKTINMITYYANKNNIMVPCISACTYKN